MTHVVIVTDRPTFEAAWTPLLTQAGVGVEVVHPERCASAMTHGRPLLIDGGAAAYDEDELLAHAALARALSIAVGVVLPQTLYAGIGELLDDVCSMRVARTDEEVPRIIASLARAGASARARFEYLTVSPRGEALLGVAGDGSAMLLPRPVHADDDGGEVLSITIAEDARTAELELASGAKLELAASLLVPARMEGTPSSSGQIAAATQELALSSIDGTKLGARVRELRLAAGLTQAELARRTGIHRPNIARVEAGRHTPSLETLARLAAAIGVPTASVLDVSGPVGSPQSTTQSGGPAQS
jgi:DNA-binding XRE family transcriptional regulator